ncbi:reverse transcriptase [Puccinia sorghi]|uniref:Reverse transcriptase n=1 Tax=Puccinia sorghi TaxID=27349 RepID=A0A0L6UH50_9BASI|nr:reverse transcriptase [Puccinia sorghi]
MPVTNKSRLGEHQKIIAGPLKYLLNIMRACLRLKTQPKIWNEEVLVTLPKPGQDQRWLKNTRVITLSCTEGKLLLTILSTKISKKLEKENFFSKAQAGFIKVQEAVAHAARINSFTRGIGTCQGCLLFIIFVNDLFREVRALRSRVISKIS